MQKILLISPYWKEQHRWMVSSVKLAELWQRLGYSVTVVCMGSETGVEKVSDTLTIHRRKDIFLPDPLNFGIAFGFAGYARRVINQEKPDIVVVNKVLFWTSFALIPLRLTGHRVLLLTDALVGMTWWPRGRIPKIIMGIGAWTMGWLVLLCANRIVTFHPQPENLLKRLGIWKKTQVIPTGIDPEPFGKEVESGKLDEVESGKCPPAGRAGKVPACRTGRESETSNSQLSTLNSQLSTLNSQLVATYIGRLESVKGVDDFLAATVAVKKSYPQLKIQVVGWYKDKHPLVSQYEREVAFPGLRDDIAAILSETDIFVLPSYSEGLSNALMEAMASGCACIASDVGGNRFLVQNGVSGFLFPAGDREALEAHLKRLLDDPSKRRSMGEAARKRIEQVFSWEVVGKQYKILFEELL